jgi:hypothetical protein
MEVEQAGLVEMALLLAKRVAQAARVVFLVVAVAVEESRVRALTL